MASQTESLCEDTDLLHVASKHAAGIPELYLLLLRQEFGKGASGPNDTNVCLPCA